MKEFFGLEPGKKEETNSLVDAVRKTINKRVAESTLPTENYESKLKTYGGKLHKYEDGRIIYETGGIMSQIDQKGDAVLRQFDDNQAKDPWKMLYRHPKAFLKTLPFNKGKRYKGGAEEIMANVARLGLSEYYGPHPDGIEIKKPELIKKGVALWDIYRQDLIDSEMLRRIDRFEAVAKAGAYLSELHKHHGAVGEYNIYPVIFETNDGQGHVDNPVLLLPAMVYNPDKNTAEIDKKATDLLDFLVSVGAEEWRRTGHGTEESKISLAMARALERYDDPSVIAMVESYAKRGRLTLPGDEELTEDFSATAEKSRTALSAHNVQRLQIKKDMSAAIRNLVIEACEQKLSNQK